MPWWGISNGFPQHMFLWWAMIFTDSNESPQWAHDVYTMSHQCWCNVMTLHWRWCNIVSTLDARCEDVSNWACAKWALASSCTSSQPHQSLIRPSFSKLTISLVNDSLKFTSSDTQICWNFLLKKCE